MTQHSSWESVELGKLIERQRGYERKTEAEFQAVHGRLAAIESIVSLAKTWGLRLLLIGAIWSAGVAANLPADQVAGTISALLKGALK